MIAIKDIEMPKNCADCNMATCNGSVESWNYVCSINLKDIDFNESERAEHCPLVEIITCKDCKHCYPDEDGRGYHCEKSDTERIPTCADFYCIHGERRE